MSVQSYYKNKIFIILGIISLASILVKMYSIDFYPHQSSSGTCRDPTAQIWSGSDLDQILSKHPAEISPCSEQFTSKKMVDETL
mgnify:CR=1 FL=1